MIYNKPVFGRNQNRIRNGFLLGQILLCVLIITIIVLFGNKIYRDDLSDIKQYRLNTEVENMKEIVSNTIIQIDMQRDIARDRVMELLKVCIAAEGGQSDAPIRRAKHMLDIVCKNKVGQRIQALVEDGGVYTLLNFENRDGFAVTQKEADDLLSQEAVRMDVKQDGYTIHFFAIQSDIDDFVKEEVYRLIHMQQFTEDSYIWVNEVLNMEGGANYAVRRIHPNMVETEGKFLSTSMQDIKGNFPYAVELEGIRKNGEVVHQYYFKNKSDDQIGKKISYAVFYEPFQWIVAMGTPLNTLYSDIGNLSEQRMTAISMQIGVVCVCVIILLFFSVKKTITGLSNAAQEAERANQAKSVFLSNMSHDIRTPMNAIIGYTKIAMKQESEPEVQDCLKKIAESSEHLLTLINDVLDISRIESGKIPAKFIPVDITSITDVVLDITRGFLSSRDIRFHVNRVTLENPYVLADPVRVREVLVNILGNAVKFTDDGGTITFTTDYHPGKDDRHIVVRYQISDTGIGMSEEFSKHIFEEFAQENAGARTQYKGSGLGMAITKHYVEMMGGTISVESEKGVGSTFTVELPLELTDKEAVQKQYTPVDGSDLMGVRVLMAEDNDLNAEIATIQLEELGLKVTRAINGKQAVQLFADSPVGLFDVILMDIMMPEMNGYEATKAIRNLSGRPDGHTIPIIAMTANAFAEDIQASLAAGMNGHLSKPIVMDEVVKTIARNL